MAVPTLITDLSTTAASNAPSGSDSPATLDDIQRAHAAFIAQLRDNTGFTTAKAAAGANSDITSLTNLTGGLAVTGAATLGYSTGAGGSVTQATSKSTAVTLNKPTGRIIMAADALAAGASVSFVFNNSLIAIADLVVFSSTFASAGYNYRIKSTVAAGSAYMTVTNETAGTLSDALEFNFAIIKGSAS